VFSVEEGGRDGMGWDGNVDMALLGKVAVLFRSSGVDGLFTSKYK
jgi:hypothetical protein